MSTLGKFYTLWAVNQLFLNKAIFNMAIIEFIVFLTDLLRYSHSRKCTHLMCIFLLYIHKVVHLLTLLILE